jgi:hypothetical protein
MPDSIRSDSAHKFVNIFQSDGDFVTIVDLPEGEHQYKFVVDGKWEHDPNQVRIQFIFNLFFSRKIQSFHVIFYQEYKKTC